PNNSSRWTPYRRHSSATSRRLPSMTEIIVASTRMITEPDVLVPAFIRMVKNVVTADLYSPFKPLVRFSDRRSPVSSVGYGLVLGGLRFSARRGSPTPQSAGEMASSGMAARLACSLGG